MKNVIMFHSKQPRKKDIGMISISSAETAFSVDERCMYFTDERPTEPLCWEEQLNSNQVKLLKQSKPTMPMDSHCYKEIGSRPVVFHQTRPVQEMLKKQKMRFHLTSCHLPKLLGKERKDTTKSNCKPPVKYLSSAKFGKQLQNKNSSLNDRLELKGSGMKFSHYMNKLVNDNCKFPEERSIDMNVHKEMYAGNDFCNQDRDLRVQTHGSRYISPEKNLPILNKTSCLHQYVDIPVSLPNPALTDESCSIVSEARDLNSDIISLDKTDKFNKTCSEEKAAKNETQHSPENTDEKSVRKSVSKITVPLEIPGNDFGKDSFRKRESNTGPGFNTPRESREGRLSSLLTYTPSTPPLFLSDEIIELPKGVSPSKALLELRQTFCENIRRETEQLEFDLQELYLKKQLHQR